MKDKAQVSKKNTLTKTVQTTVAALASTVLLGVGNAQANAQNIFIDEFLDFQMVETTGPLTNSQVGPTGNILGGYRDIFVDKNGDSQSLTSKLSVENGKGYFNNDTGVTGIGIIRWDGVNDSQTLNPQGLGGINITQGNLDSISMDIMLADLAGLDMTFTIYDMNSNSSSISRILNSSMSTSQEEVFLFQDFVGTADFTNVGAIQLDISRPESMDAMIGPVRISKSTPVPEPTSILGLLAIGAVGTGSMLKQKKNN
ncbi:PEP-CTERM sorting domain-containing protein [Trichodesmium erythraeum 21-75]|nr:PEP-CTERM sorting domain-containing protein [Trichodesmium erythraeum 21-75]